MNIKQGRTKKASWKGGLHRKVHTRVWTTNPQAYEPLYFFCDGSNGQYVALARHTFIGPVWHPMTSSHITSQHMTSPPRNGWRLVDTKNSEEPSVTLPRPNWSDHIWHYHAQIEVLASTLSNLLSNKNTGYERSTCLSSSWPVWVRAVFGKYPVLEIWSAGSLAVVFLGRENNPWSGLACLGHAVEKDVSGDTLYKTGFHELYLHIRFPRRSWCFSGDHQLD